MQKKIPQRQCMGCRERKAKRELIRVVRGTDGSVCLDFSGKLNGRGAYICPDPNCLKKAQKARSLDRSLEVPIPEEVYDRLAKEMGVETSVAPAKKSGRDSTLPDKDFLRRRLENEINALYDRLAQALKAENERLRKENAALKTENEQLKA